VPEELGINSSDLKPIDSLVNDAILKKAIPGCVVYLAKDGKVFYNKPFGYFNYDSARKVRNSDVYDLASITKVAATTPSLMMLYDKKKINISDRLSKYLPEIVKTNKKKITFKEILAHQARLQSWVPFYLQTLKCENPDDKISSKISNSSNSIKINETTFVNCNTKYKENIYSKKSSKEFPVNVADSLFIRHEWHDSIYFKIYKSELLPKPVYHYSDIGFMLLSEAVKNITNKPFDSNLDSLFYKPLGASTLGFHPLKKIKKSEIAPTENDFVFRKQLIQGYVHDPTAAMLGGTCGHAGLFANANDLGKLMQVYLNKGEYGGKRYFNETTVQLFTSRPFAKNGNRRALGFDKPEPDTSKKSPVSRMCSDESYGHTGFTGTMAWVDPQYNLVFIFLSNRVCPDATINKLADINLRTNIQDVVYKALKKGNIKK
jgi:CubicO group peptidase (beta-lactamase class C family)